MPSKTNRLPHTMNRVIHYIIIVTALLLPSKAYSEVEVAISCIDVAADTITFNNADWSPLFDHLKELNDTILPERKTVSIVHLGDSHVQAGYFSEALRLPSQRYWGNAGRGLISPLKLSRTNEPHDYAFASPVKWSYNRCIIGKHFDSEVGVSGISIQPVSSHIDLTLQTLSREGEGERFCSLRLFHSSSDKFPQLLPTSAEEIEIDYKCGETHYRWAPAAATNNVHLHGANSYGKKDAAIYGAMLENDSSGVLVHAIGNNSATYECYNRISQYGTKLAALQPQLVIISMGTNESVSSATSRETLYGQIDRLVTTIRQDNPNALILLTTPADNKLRKTKRRNKRRTVYYTRNPHIETVVETIRQYGSDHNIAVWDWYTISGGKDSCETWIKEKGMKKDHIHYTEMGYTLQGELLFKSIFKAYEQHIQ